MDAGRRHEFRASQTKGTLSEGAASIMRVKCTSVSLSPQDPPSTPGVCCVCRGLASERATSTLGPPTLWLWTDCKQTCPHWPRRETHACYNAQPPTRLLPSVGTLSPHLPRMVALQTSLERSSGTKAIHSHLSFQEA